MFQFGYNAVSTHNVKFVFAQEVSSGYWQITVYYFNEDKPATLSLGRVSEDKAYKTLKEFIDRADCNAPADWV